MKIAINALPYTSWQGIEVFLFGLLKAWPNDPNDKVLVFANKNSAQFLQGLPEHIKIVVIPFSNLSKAKIFLHQQLSFTKILKKNKVDVLFCPSLMTPWFFKNKIVTIHDAAPFIIKGETSYLGRLFWKINLFPIKLLSNKIVTVSEFSRQEIIDRLKIKKDKISVIGVNALSPLKSSQTEEVINRFSLTNKKYFISIGNARTRKNLTRLISAFNAFNKQEPEARLLIVGKKDKRMIKLESENKNEMIIFTGFISNTDKSTLMSQAEALIFPSYYEGFGIPIIEAQQLNVPVLCSGIPVFKEVARLGALFFNPLDESNITSALKEIFNNQDLKTKLIEQGARNHARYSWENITKKLLNIIKNENTSS